MRIYSNRKDKGLFPSERKNELRNDPILLYTYALINDIINNDDNESRSSSYRVPNTICRE